MATGSESDRLRQSLVALRQMSARLDAMERARTEPIAVIGLGCRFPGGGTGPDGYWRMLRDGVDAVREVPSDRWDVDAYFDPDPTAPGKIASRWGAFLDGVDEFDAAFFGISPREAEAMDPQQRMVLEVGWEALEDAGLPTDRLAGSATGVFLGMCTNDYMHLSTSAASAGREIDAYFPTGTAFSVAAGRLSYLLGLQGPSLVVDTACSSSLVAVHLACQSLRQGECRLAIAGGVSLVLSPLSPMALSKLRMLAPDGRCKAFDAAADGFVQGEGCGLVVLKRLSDALADGDPIRAVIRGSAVNQDGRSSGLTVPNGPAQMAVMRAALAAGGTDPRQVRYVEAHGTGTSLGDPIEVRALTEVLSPGRAAGEWLAVASVKTNIGHLEAAAGIAGLIKVVLALQHGEIPPHLHLGQLNPHIDLAGRDVRFPAQPLAWPTADGPRVAGVSSFGFSGTNAHVVLEQAPTAEARSEPVATRPHQLICLSARDETALHELARCYARRLAGETLAGLSDCSFTSRDGRTHFPERLAVVAADAQHAADLLGAAVRGERPAGVWRGRAEPGFATGENVPMPDDSTHGAQAHLETMAGRYVRGATIPAQAVHPIPRRKVHLPTYRFQRQRYWLTEAIPTPSSATPTGLLGRRMPSAGREVVFESQWSAESPAILGQHRIYETVVVPAACQVAAALAAANAALGHASSTLHDVLFREAMVLSPGTARTVRLVLNPTEQGTTSFALSSLDATDGRKTGIVHATGKLTALAADHTPVTLPIAELEYACEQSRSGGVWLYDRLRGLGIELGPRFQWVGDIGHGHEEALACVRAPGSDDAADGTLVPPGLIDACFQMLSATLAGPAQSEDAFVPFGIDRLHFHASPTGPTFCHAQLRAGQPNQETVTGDVCLADLSGRRLLEVEGLHVRRAPRAVLLREGSSRGRPESTSSDGEGRESPATLRDELDRAPAELRGEVVLNHVTATAARILKLDPARSPAPNQPLHELGLDSLMAIELRDALNQSTGLSLPATLLFNQPTPAALADHLAEMLLAAERATPMRMARPAAHDEPIAIVGIGCRFPGGADGPAEFWDLLRRGVHTSTVVPADRWDVEAYYDPTPGTPGKMATRHAAFLGEVDRFDAEFFGITPREAAAMDPQQRLVLEVGWEALEHAGIAPDRLAGSATGVFLGLSTNDYAHLGLQSGDPSRIDVYSGTGGSFSVAAGRLSYVLGLQGPSLAIDTACSSSLVAVHLACQSLRQGESDLALAGGVNLILSPVAMISLSQLRMLAPDGRCKTFDAGADGYVRGEGCGLVVLKRQSDALAAGDRVLAVIRGSAVNQDGRSGGLTAPNGPAQEAVIRAALAVAGVDGADIGYAEAHGTGTSLGDPIEVQALANVLTPGRPADRPLQVGAVKTNFGHLEAAAGVAGLIKTVLALHHQTIPPHLHLHTLNPHIHLDGLPIEIPTRASSWPAGTARRLAGVSAFGFSGTNAHIVLEEAPQATAELSAVVERPQHLLCLSARDEPALRALAARYAERMAEESADGLAVCAAAAYHGRAHLAERLAVEAADGAEAAALLEAAARGECPPGVWTGRVKTGTVGKSMAFSSSSLSELAARFVAGGAIDWDDSNDGRAWPRVDLPTYPFQRQRHWLDLPTPQVRRTAGKYSRVGHSLLGRRLRSAVPCFESELPTDSLALLADHRVHGEAVLPAAAYIEMALAAAERSVVGTALEDVLFLEPLVLHADRPRNVQTVLSVGESGETAVRILSLPADEADDATWVLHATGTLRPAAVDEAPAVSPGRLRQRFNEPIPVDSYYEGLRAGGADYGPRFRGLTELWGREGEALARVRLPDECEGAVGDYRLHPVLLDAAFHMLGVAFGDSATGRAALPAALDRIRLYRPPERELWAHGIARPATGEGSLIADVRLYDTAGRLVAEVTGLHLRPVREAPAVTSRLADWLCAVEWRVRPVVSLDLPLDLVADFTGETDASDSGLDDYRAMGPRLDALCGAYARRALDQIGVNGRPYPPDTVTASRHGVGPRFVRLLGRLIEMASEDHSVARRIEDPDRLHQELATQYPACSAELTLLGRCGPRLADVLRGNCDGLPLLFPDGSVDDAERLYRESPFTAAVNRLAADAVSRALAKLPAWRMLRVLEIGAGTGGTTASLLPRLPADRTEYVFTDVSPRFLDRATETFREYPFLRTQVLDIETDPGRQGFAEGSFDIVVAANVLHATAHLRESLAHVRRLLAPSGLLMLVEGTGRQRLLDLTFGLTDGWWRFADTEIRPDYPLLSREQWVALIAEAGFERARALPEADPAGVFQHQAVLVANAPVAPHRDLGKWLILSDHGGIGSRLAERLAARGATCTVVAPGEPDASGGTWHGVVDLRALDVRRPDDTLANTLAADQRVACEGLLTLVQSLVRTGERLPRLWFVTRGARTAGPDERVSAPAATAWGLARVVAREHPDLRCTGVDLDGSHIDPDGEAEQLLVTVLAEDTEDQTAWRAGRRLAARLTPWIADDTSTVPVREDGVYAVVGGLGGLGRVTARCLVDRGARRIVLAGRSDPSLDAARDIAELERLGAQVRVVPMDVSVAAEAARLLEAVAELGGELRGVVHSAGVLDDGVLLHQDWPRFERVLAPKTLSAWNLHVLTRACPLDFFVLYSSAAALLGSAGQANHAAANAFLDALAHDRRAQGLPAISVGWGPWATVGAAAARGADRTLGRKGLGTISPTQGLEILDMVLGSRAAHVGVLPVNWGEFIGSPAPPFLAEMARTVRPSASPTPGGDTFLARLRNSSPQERSVTLRDMVRTTAAEIMRVDHGRLDPTQPLHELGLDSLLAVELRNGLGKRTGSPLPATLLFNYPSIESLAEYLGTHVFNAADTVPRPVAVTATDEHDLSGEELAALFAEELSVIEAKKL